jgi:LuxR family maltose regulon positive regulatory protein
MSEADEPAGDADGQRLTEPHRRAVVLRARGDLAKQRAMSMYRNACRLHERAAQLQDRLGRDELAEAASQRAERARSRHHDAASVGRPTPGGIARLDDNVTSILPYLTSAVPVAAVPVSAVPVAALPMPAQLLGPQPSVRSGAVQLTPAELRLLPLLATHLSFREIGDRLFVSRTTVKTQAMSIYRKLGVSSRSQAVQHGQQLGLLPALP